MIQLVISNQRGGIGKTTTAITLARIFADTGRRVLLVDTDPQGSVYITLALQDIKGWFYQLVCDQVSVTEVVTPAYKNLDVICSNKMTMRAESTLGAAPAREMTYKVLFSPFEKMYDVILFDVAPSISHVQSCSIAYAKNVLIPVGMDLLSVEGALASINTMEFLNKMLNLGCQPIGFLPTMVNKRFSATTLVLDTLADISQQKNIPVLHPIRTDQAVNHASREHRFLQDYDPTSKALEDYLEMAKQLLDSIKGTHVQAEAPATA
jgi:chromosome partitioning protein